MEFGGGERSRRPEEEDRATLVHYNNVFPISQLFHGPQTVDRIDRIVKGFSRSPPYRPPRTLTVEVTPMILL